MSSENNISILPFSDIQKLVAVLSENIDSSDWWLSTFLIYDAYSDELSGNDDIDDLLLLKKIVEVSNKIRVQLIGMFNSIID